jgi:hypothetical protein
VKARDLRIIWRQTLCESDSIDRTAKLVGLVISLHMDPDGFCFPGRQRIAWLCSLSDRAVDGAVRRLEAAGFLRLERSKGGNSKPNHYFALMPETANELRRSGPPPWKIYWEEGFAESLQRMHIPREIFDRLGGSGVDFLLRKIPTSRRQPSRSAERTAATSTRGTSSPICPRWSSPS